MKKALLILLSLAILCVPLAACGGDDSPAPTQAPPAGNDPAPTEAPADPPSGGGDLDDVTLRLWGGEVDGNQEMLREMADAFIASVADRVNLTIEIGIVSEADARDAVLTDPQAAADVFAMADDQLMSLYRAGALQEITVNADGVRADNLPVAVEAASIDGRLFAYPMTADNGYFLFYNSSYFTEEDVQSWDRMAQVAEEAGKQVTMEIANGWWGIAFPRTVGLDAWLEDDGATTGCNFNAEGGTDMLQAIMDLVAKPGFIALPSSDFITVISDGSVIAGVNGPWNNNAVADVWGDNYAAAKLPTLNVNGQQMQMGGVIGCKLLGVNSYSENVGWAMELANFLTNYENQMRRFEVLGQGPSNIQAAASPAVQGNPGLAALAAQSAYSDVISVGGNYWGPAETLFGIVANGNPDGIDLQELLDNAVADITS